MRKIESPKNFSESRDYPELHVDGDEGGSPELQNGLGSQDALKQKSCPQLSVEIILLVLPFLDPKCSMTSIILLASFTFPRITFAILPFSLGNTGEKLSTTGVWFSIYHEQDARIWVLWGEIFILTFLCTYGIATSVIMVCEVTIPAHNS